MTTVPVLSKQLKNPVVQMALEKERETVARHAGVQEVNLTELQSQITLIYIIDTSAFTVEENKEIYSRKLFKASGALF